MWHPAVYVRQHAHVLKQTNHTNTNRQTKGRNGRADRHFGCHAFKQNRANARVHTHMRRVMGIESQCSSAVMTHCQRHRVRAGSR